MKKIFLFLTFLLSYTTNLFSFEIMCYDRPYPALRDSGGVLMIDYDAVKVVLDQSGSVHFTRWSKIFTEDDYVEYLKKNKFKKQKTTKDRYNFASPIRKNLKSSYKEEEYFTSISHKAGNKFKTPFRPDENNVTELIFGTFLSIDLDNKTVKVYRTVSDESKHWWNSNWDEEEAKKHNLKKIGAPYLSLHMINCETGSSSGYLDYWWALILILAVTFFIYTQSGKQLGKIRKSRK